MRDTIYVICIKKGLGSVCELFFELVLWDLCVPVEHF